MRLNFNLGAFFHTLSRFTFVSSFTFVSLLHPLLSTTGIEACASGFITHSLADFPPLLPPVHSDDIDSDWPSTTPSARGLGSIPNLVVTSGNVHEIYAVRLQEAPSLEAKRAAVISGVSGATLELVCSYRLHGNVESVQVLFIRADVSSQRRDSIILDFRDAKVSVLEYDDATHGLCLSQVHVLWQSTIIWFKLTTGQLSTDLGPDLQIQFHHRALPALVSAMDDFQNPRVQACREATQKSSFQFQRQSYANSSSFVVGRSNT